MHRATPSSNIYRGTIIVDANVIYHLFCPVNPDFYNPNFTQEKKPLNNPSAKRIHHYLGILEFLARNGFHIVIPEMVSAETGSVLACGTSMYDYADIPEDERPKLHDRQLVKLLQRVAHNYYPNIAMVEIRDPEHPDLHAPAELLRDMHGVKDHPPGSEEARGKMNEITNRVKTNFGDKAILGYIADTRQQGHDNIFVLSDDGGALERIGKECHVPVLNANALLRSFIRNGLHKGVGLNDNVKAMGVLRDCSGRRAKVTGREQRVSRFWIDQQWREGEAEPTVSVFSKKMQELAEDMGLNSWQQNLKRGPEGEQERA
jgi:hypothetical protein